MKIMDTVGDKDSTGSTKIEKAVDWLVFGDRLDTKISSNQDFELMRYQPYTIIIFHQLFASTIKTNFEFPRIDYEVCNRIILSLFVFFFNTALRIF
jgi:hypothetical protein